MDVKSDRKFQMGEEYWTFYKDRVFQTRWRNDIVDRQRLREQRIFKTNNEAKKALGLWTYLY